MSEPKTLLAELLFALEALLPPETILEIKAQLAPYSSLRLGLSGPAGTAFERGRPGRSGPPGAFFADCAPERSGPPEAGTGIGRNTGERHPCGQNAAARRNPGRLPLSRDDLVPGNQARDFPPAAAHSRSLPEQEDGASPKLGAFPGNTPEPDAPFSSGPEADLYEPDLHEPRWHEPGLHEPELHEPGLGFLGAPAPDGESLEEFTNRMEAARRYPLRFAALNFRCVIAALAALIERDRLEELSASLLLLMIGALEQAERAAGRCRACTLGYR